MQRREPAGWADAAVPREIYGGQLVSVAITREGRRALDYGDVARVIPQWSPTPVISQANLAYINGRRFVPVQLARTWVKDLETKQYKTTAKSLADLLDWAEALQKGVHHAA